MELSHQSHLWSRTHTSELEPVVGRRSLCQASASLKHLLSGCTTSLTQGRYTCQHNQVIKQLASILEQRQTTTNTFSTNISMNFPLYTFLINRPTFRISWQQKMQAFCMLLETWGWTWARRKKLVFPPDIVATTLRPDIVLRSRTANILKNNVLAQFFWIMTT